MLAQRTDPEALVERSRYAFFQENAPDKALRLADSALRANCTSEQQLLAQSLRLVFSAALGAESDVVDPALFASCSTNCVSEAIYFIALASYMRGDYSTATVWIRSHAPSNPSFAARFLFIDGLVVAAERADYRTQASALVRAITLLLAEAPDEIHLLQSCAETLAYLVRDIPAMDGLTCITSVINSPVYSEFSEATLQCRRALAWNCAINGSYHAAFGHLHAIEGVVPRGLHRAYVLLDRAAVSIFCGERIGAYSCFEAARGELSDIGWESIGRGHIGILPLAGQVAAELGDVHSASKFCELAERHKGDLVKHTTLAHGSRMTAMLAEARALTYAGTDSASSTSNAAAAYTTYMSIGYEWRAARMALLLHQLTRKETWRTCALGHLKHYPQSPLHRLLSTNTSARTLTAQQQRVLDLVRKGYSTNRIATELNRSPDTVRIHLGRLHRHFGVKNRQQLLARVASDAAS